MDKIYITLDQKQKLFFTSDLHFGHKNILNFCQRPFTDVKHMEVSLINYWNSCVTNKDIAFILGDIFWFNNSRDIKRIFKQLNGQHIYVILGNHCDPNVYEKLKNEGVFEDRISVVSDVTTIILTRFDSEIPNKLYIGEFVLSHYPLLTWSHRDKGAINLFGHIHSGPKSLCTFDLDLPLWKDSQYDVGVDNNNYHPIELNEVLKKLNRIK